MHNESSSKTSGRLWPTPQAHDAKGPKTKEQIQSMRERTGAGVSNLNEAVRESIETSEPSTANNSEESHSLQQVSLANLHLAPGSDEARKTTVGSGRRLLGYLVSACRLGPSLKTLLESCLSTTVWNSSVCFLRWKVSVTPFNRLLFQLVPSMPDTDVTEFGLWPTVRASDGERGGRGDLIQAARDWRSGKSNTPPLNAAVKMFPTPTASMATEADMEQARFHSSNRPSYQEAKMFSTPDVGEAKGRGEASADNRSRLGGGLNPNFVEWLMGYPKDWTALPDGPKKTRKRRVSQPASKTETPG